jgi:tRNA (adenine22-N1)-methyltransferase
MTSPKLGSRLLMAANMVREGAVVADIGTDHAYLPVYLVKAGIAKGAVASDLRKGPLKNAQQTVSQYGLNEKIALRLSDGLDNIKSHEVDDIVLAGMGGTLIVKLLERTPWIKDKSKRLVIQPMSHPEDVREFLCREGFEIIREDACVDFGRVYIAINAVYEGNIKEYEPEYFYIGRLPECENGFAGLHLKKQLQRIEKRAESLKEAGKSPEEQQWLFELTLKIKQVVEKLERRQKNDKC